MRLGNAEGAFLDLHLRLQRKAQHGDAGDAVQDVTGQLAGDDAVALDDIGVVRGAFGHEAILDKPAVIDMGLLGHHLGHRGIEELHGLDVAAAPADIRHRNDLPAQLGCGVFGEARLGLGEHHQRRFGLGAGIGEIAVAGIAAGDLQIDHAVRDVVQRDQFAVGGQQVGIRTGGGHVQFTQAAGQPGAMAGKVDQLAIQHRGHFINAVRHQEAAVEDRDGGLVLGQILAVQIDRSRQSCA